MWTYRTTVATDQRERRITTTADGTSPTFIHHGFTAQIRVVDHGTRRKLGEYGTSARNSAGQIPPETTIPPEGMRGDSVSNATRVGSYTVKSSTSIATTSSGCSST